jgi:hypothetical protein
MRICRALGLHDGVTARFAVLDATGGVYDRMQFDLDLQWAKDQEEIIELARTADVLHLHNFIDLASRHFAPIDINKLWMAGKPMVRQFHSSPESIAAYMKTPISALYDCPIPKLVIAQFQARYYPTAKLVPNIVFGGEMRRDGGPRKGSSRVGYAPTRFNSGRAERWDTKGYRETMKMLQSVSRKAASRNIEIEVDCIEQASHAECLRRKAACHVVIDDLVTGSYHLNTLESLAAGSACLTYMDRATQQAVFDLTGRGDFPALSVGLEDAEAVLLALAADRPLVVALGQHACNWMARHWAPKDMARHFLAAYEHVLANPHSPFPRRGNGESTVQAWMDVGLNDLIWANRKQRWPSVMPDWLRGLRGGAGQALRRIGLK